MKTTRKLIVALVLVMTMLIAMAVAVIPASAQTMTGGEKLYLKPNSNWTQANARFAIYVFGNGEAWANMSDPDGDGIYEATVPAGSWTNVIFCRMNPSTTANNWNNKWNQTGNLTYDGTKNQCAIKDGQWDCGSNVTWSKYTPPACTDHNLGSNGKCTNDGCDGGHYYTVAGSKDLCGTEWTPSDNTNDMTYADGVYTKVYENVNAGSYEFKCVQDHAWGTEYPAQNKTFKVHVDGSKVTITFNLDTKAVDVAIDCPHSWSDATCTEEQKCACGATQGEALDHKDDNHDHICDNGCEETQGTHTPAGEDTHICEYCGERASDCTGGQATCSEQATCSVCGEKYGATPDHEYEFACSTHCRNCGEATNPEATHDLGEVAAKDATCTEGGNIAYYGCSYGCGICYVDDGEGNQIPTIASRVFSSALGHDMVTDAAVDPSCTETGLTEGSHCSRCNDATTAQVVVAATGHNYASGVCVNADCGRNGTFFLVPNSNWKKDGATFAVYFFTNAGDNGPNAWAKMTKISDDLYSVVIPDGQWDKMIFCRMNTTGNTGWTNKWNQTGDLVIPVTGNNNLFTVPSASWDGATATWSHYCYGGTATCTAQAECSVCGEKYGEALGHAWADATCTAPKTCGTCGATEGDALGHSIVDGACTNAGCTTTLTLEDKLSGTGTVVLGDLDLGENDLLITGDVTVVLNGTIKAAGVTTTHETVRFEGDGKLAIPQGRIVLAGESKNMPVWVGDGYVFNEVTNQSKSEVGEDDSFNVVFRPSFGSTEHNEAILGGETDAGLTFELQIWDGETRLFAGTINAELVKQAYAKGGAISIRVKNAPAGTYTVKLVIKSSVGITFTETLQKVEIKAVQSNDPIETPEEEF